MFLCYVLSFFKNRDTIQGGHYLRKYGTYLDTALYNLLYVIYSTIISMFHSNMFLLSVCVLRDRFQKFENGKEVGQFF